METPLDSVVYIISNTKTDFDWAALLSAIAATFSAIAAAVAIYFAKRQIEIQEHHNRLMATPHLLGISHVEIRQFIYIYAVENAGIGPAIINSLQVTVDGVEVTGKGIEQIENALLIVFPERGFQSIIETFSTGEFVPVGKKYELFRLIFNDRNTSEIETEVHNRLKIKISYTSIYGEPNEFTSSLS